MKAGLLTKQRCIELGDVPIPFLGDDDVLIKLEYVGICGSDMHYYEHGGIGKRKVTYPHVLGHEPAGIIEKVGKNIHHLMPGDRVTVEPGVACKTCDACKKGMYNLCINMEFMGRPPFEGAFKEFLAHPADKVYKLPDHIDTKTGCLMEPLSVGFYAVKTSGISLGERAVVMGAGCIGLMTLMSLKAAGVSDITVTDAVDSRLAKAMELGATRTVNITKESITDVILDLYPTGIDVVFEASGNAAALLSSSSILCRGGTVIVMGYPSIPETPLNVSEWLDKEITVKSVFRYRHVYPLAIKAVENGTIPLHKAITDVFDLDDLGMAMEQCVTNKEDIIKAVIKIN